MQQYALLRGAVFAQSGYNLNLSEIAPDGLKKEMNAVFCALDSSGKTVRIERIPGCSGEGEDMVAVPLRPYPRADMACACLSVICSNLPDAMAGDDEAKRNVGVAWSVLLFNTLAIEAQDLKTQVAILNNAYGAGRVHEALNRFGSVSSLGAPDPVLMVNEALGLA